MRDGESLTMRSIYVSTADYVEKANDLGVEDPSDAMEQALEDRWSVINGANDDESKEVITLPQGTYSLLFTEPVCSLSFLFGFAVLCISCSSLSFALIDALQPGEPGNHWNIPADVAFTVRGAQYMAILIALIMEEEIPTGLYLLRMIPRESFENRFPQRSYSKFVISSVLRIGMGYLFLLNVFIVLIQATSVLDIFYDVMALQFVQQIDDVGFKLAKVGGMLGKSIYRATTSKCYRAEFKKQKGGKRIRIFLKLVYLVNLGLFLALMMIVSIRQHKGEYQCKEVTINFGDIIWSEAVVKMSTGQYEDRVLLYKYFDGFFVADGERHDGRLVYKEMRKYDGTPYENKIGAAIIFCKAEGGSWVLTHQDIQKSKYFRESGCSSWLLRSPETTSYDILDVNGVWDVWIGTISQTSVSITCNFCQENADCNLNGQCVDGKCKCFNVTGGHEYLGNHCEVKFHDGCETIIAEGNNDTWFVPRIPPSNELLQLYNRPVYFYNEGHPVWHEKGIRCVVYSGGRWLVLEIEDYKNKPSREWIIGHTAEYHAFWDDIYASNTLYVSDRTDSSTPVGVDIYKILNRGEQYGPFGELTPVEVSNHTGKGFWRCHD